MATTSNTYTGNGSNKLFSITFPYLATSDVDVYLNGTLQTITTQYSFANATTIEFVTAPANGAVVLLDRSTDDSDNPATFFPGSSIKANDLNDNFDQTLYVVQEINNKAVKVDDPLYANKTYIDAQDATKVNKSGDTMSGNLAMAGNKITDLGTTSNANDAATKTYVDNNAILYSGSPGFTQDGAGAVTRSWSSKLKDVVSVKDFGAVGDGTTDDRNAIKVAIEKTAATGQRLYVPAGTYLIAAGTVFPATTGSIDIECETGAIFKASSSLPVSARVFYFAAGARGRRFNWRGGKIDGRLMPTTVIGTAPDLLSVNGFDDVSISETHLLCNDDRTGTAGDSCLFLADCYDVTLTSNIFQGAKDAGVYVSADATGVFGKRIACTSNTFLECTEVAFISKRVYQQHIVANNYISKCNNGIVVGGSADSLLAGKLAIITANYVEDVVVGIEARLSDLSIISGNKVVNYGINALSASVVGYGIKVSGSSKCLVSENLVNTTSTNASTAGIELNNRVEGATTYNSTYNVVSGNVIHNSPLGIIEVGAATNFNRYVGNHFIDTVVSKVILAGPDSIYGEVYDGTTTPGFVIGSGTLLLGAANAPSLGVVSIGGSVNYVTATGSAGSTASIGTAGASTDINLALICKGTGSLLFGGAANSESLRVSPGTTNGNAVQVQGAAAGSSPAILARGTDTNVDLALTPKGTGRVQMGTHTATTDVPITGYIEIKDSAGTVRRLAVIS
jgi:hypothetical protein